MTAHSIVEKGPVKAARHVVMKEGGTDGFHRLWELKKLSLSVEAIILKEEFNELFTEEERKVCRERLGAYGYKP